MLKEVRLNRWAVQIRGLEPGVYRLAKSEAVKSDQTVAEWLALAIKAYARSTIKGG